MKVGKHKDNDKSKNVAKKKNFGILKKETQKKNMKHNLQNEWFYMSPIEVSASMIAEVAKEVNYGDIELWEELNILEITLGDGKSIDFEPQRVEFKDKEDQAFVNEREIKSIFAVTFSHCTIDEFRPFVKYLLDKWNGVFCADTFDFNPRIENSN
ncbi:MAG: hypothetical protein ACK5JH_07510 [Anaerocolumna sp.]